MTIGQAGAAWLSECWKPCPELPLGDRIEKRKNDRQQQRDLEEQGIHSFPGDVHSLVEEASTSCSEIDSEGAA